MLHSRRTFTRRLGAGALALLAARRLGAVTEIKEKLIKPKALKKGDTIGLITPGSYIDDEGLEKAVKNLEDMGFHVKTGRHIRAERGFTAGTDAQRLDDLHRMFADDGVAGIWCARGGYGCSRLLPYIDYRLIRRHPKVLIGYSDITALLQAIHRETKLVCFHGPVAASEFTDYTRSQVSALLMDGAGPHTIELSEANGAEEEPAFQPTIIRGGKAAGPLFGGNLSLLAALAGTNYRLDATGKLLFIEDIGEKPYRIDRMLTQLRQSARLSAAAGIALGVFADCEPAPDDRSLSLRETLQDRLGDLGIPVAYGLSFGHIDNQCTLPVGIPAELDAGNHRLTILERAVSER